MATTETVQGSRPWGSNDELDYAPGDPMEWKQHAACAGVDPEIFYPEHGGSSRPARAICATCPVREPCLRYALFNDSDAFSFGVWGGTSPRERRELRRLGSDEPRDA